MAHTSKPNSFITRQRVLITLTIVALVVVTASFLFRPLVHRYVTKVLNKSPEYQSSIGEINIHLWRGAYQIRDLVIKKASGNVPVPLFSSKTIDISVEWRELFRGALVGEIEVENSQLNFVGASSNAASQTGAKADWAETARELFPLKINRLGVSNSEIHYRDFQTKPQVDIYLKDVTIEASNLTNSRKLSQTLLAHIKASARGAKSGQLAGEMSLDPYSPRPTFDLALSLLDVHLPDLNDFLRAYAAVDASKGKFSIFGELSARKTSFTGYVKPLLSEVQLLDLRKDPSQPLTFIWESLVAAVVEVFTNQRNDQLATKIPISGTFENPDAGLWSSFLYLAQNAFIRALRPGFEGELEFRRTHSLNQEED